MQIARDSGVALVELPINLVLRALPDWKLLTPAEWRQRHAVKTGRGDDGGILPGQAHPDEAK